MAELRLDSVSHTLGIMEQPLVVDLYGAGFNDDTRVSMALDIGNTKAIIESLDTDLALKTEFDSLIDNWKRV